TGFFTVPFGLAVSKVDVVRHDLISGSFVSLPVGPRAGLQAAIDGNEPAFGEVFADEFCCAAPGDNVQAVGFSLFALAESTVAGDAEGADGDARLRLAQFRVGAQAPGQCDAV